MGSTGYAPAAVRLRTYVAMALAGSLVPVLLALQPSAAAAVVAAFLLATATARRLLPRTGVTGLVDGRSRSC
jgi:hypothetical protein